MTILFLLCMIYFSRYSCNKGLLWFVTGIGVLSQTGFQLNGWGLLISIGIFKVLKDVFSK